MFKYKHLHTQAVACNNFWGQVDLVVHRRYVETLTAGVQIILASDHLKC